MWWWCKLSDMTCPSGSSPSYSLNFGVTPASSQARNQLRVTARGAEESREWRQPEDLVALCDEASGHLSELFAGAPLQRSVATLARAVLREDAGFHAYQMLEAGVRQFADWGGTDEGRHILISDSRYR